MRVSPRSAVSLLRVTIRAAALSLATLAVLATPAVLAVLVAPAPPALASALPTWSGDPHVYVTGAVRCEGADLPKWVWIGARNGENGWAQVWSQRAGGGQFGQHFTQVPQGGTDAVAYWTCGYDADQYSTTFRVARPWWGTTITVNMCPSRPCVP